MSDHITERINSLNRDLAHYISERDELRAALQQIMDARSRTATDVNNAIERAGPAHSSTNRIQMSTRTERINWIAMHLVGELQMVASKDYYLTTVQALNTAVDGELATLKEEQETCAKVASALLAERNELREALSAIVGRLDGFDLNFCFSENNETNELLEKARHILARTTPCEKPSK